MLLMDKDALILPYHNAKVIQVPHQHLAHHSKELMEFAMPHLLHLAQIELARMMPQRLLLQILNVVLISKVVLQKGLDAFLKDQLVKIILGRQMNVVSLLVPLVIVLSAQQAKQLELPAKLKHAPMLHQHWKRMQNALPIPSNALQIMVEDVLSQAVATL